MPNVKVECVRRVGKYFNTIVYYIVFPLPFGSDPLQGSRKHTVEVFVGVRAVPRRFREFALYYSKTSQPFYI